MMHEAVEQRGDHDHVAEQLRPVFEGPVGGDDGGALFIAAHEHVGELVAGLDRQLAQEEIVDEQEVDGAELRTELADGAEFARFVDVFEQLMRLAEDDFVARLMASRASALGAWLFPVVRRTKMREIGQALFRRQDRHSLTPQQCLEVRVKGHEVLPQLCYRGG